MRSERSDRQLATVIRHLARTHLEVERGLRDPDQLRPWLAPAAHFRLRHPDRPRFGHAGPVTPQDLGTVRLTRISHDHLYAAIPTRETGDRWGVLMLELRTTPDRQRWWITGLERLRQPPTPDVPPPDQRPTDPDVTRQQQEHTPEHGPETRPPTLRASPITERFTRDSSVHSDPAALLLGKRPNDDHGRHVWEAALGEIRHYRTRWQLTDYTDGVLGPLPDNPQQRHERDRLLNLIKVLAPLLDRALQRDTTARDRSLGLER